jgi:hypothetical protein
VVVRRQVGRHEIRYVRHQHRVALQQLKWRIHRRQIVCLQERPKLANGSPHDGRETGGKETPHDGDP